MTPIALQNNGQLTAVNHLCTDGKGRITGGSGNVSPEREDCPFPVIFDGMVHQSSPHRASVPSSVGRNADNAGNAVSKADGAKEQGTPASMAEEKALSPGEEKDEESSEGMGETRISPSGSDADRVAEDALNLELDLRVLLQAVQNEKAARQNPGVPAGELELTPDGMRDRAGTIQSAIDKILSSGGGFSVDGTDKGNKILLTLPQAFLEDFVINENGQPHFSRSGSLDGTLSGEMDPAVLGPDGGDRTLRLIRLNMQASSSSPQGALLAAVMATDSEITDPDGPIPGNSSSGETLLKPTGEPRVHEAVLYPETGNDPEGTIVKGETDSQPGFLSSDTESGEEVRTAANVELDAEKGASAVRENTTKSTRLITGTESSQWVSNAGLSSPQVAPDTTASIKGVFIPLNEVVNKAVTALEKGGKVQMTLQPPSLGTINMEVVVQNNRVELVLKTGHADVQQMLQAGTDQLKSALQNQGFQIDQMSVLLRQENFTFNPGGNPLLQDGSEKRENKGNGSSSVPSIPGTEPVVPRDDYGTGMISIFA